METIRLLKDQGYEIDLQDGDIRCRLVTGNPPSKDKIIRLFADLKENKAEAVAFLKRVECQDKDHVEIVDPEVGKTTITVFSKVLGREVFISWQGENPQSILFDGVAYTIDEIVKLRELPLTPEDLRTIHRVKVQFEGEVLD